MTKKEEGLEVNGSLIIEVPSIFTGQDEIFFENVRD
jgi:hypothetical protein